MFTLLSWNIKQGGGSRLSRIQQCIQDTKPTVCVFSEYHNNKSGFTLRSFLMERGYKFQFVTAALSSENSVLIVSQLPCTSEVYPMSDITYSNNILAVHFEVFSICGVYLPHKKKHRLFDFLLDYLPHSTKPFIICGDFNSGINGIDQEGDSFWYEDKMKNLPKIGYLDAFRYLHGNTLEYSWYSYQGNGYRYDHTYIHESLVPLIKDCKYLHEWRENKASDHAPMLLVLA